MNGVPLGTPHVELPLTLDNVIEVYNDRAHYVPSYGARTTVYVVNEGPQGGVDVTTFVLAHGTDVVSIVGGKVDGAVMER
jgi:hypothetical protein